MRIFTIIATRQQSGRVAFEMEVRVTVEAPTLNDAYRLMRAVPQFKHAYLRPE